MAILGQIIKSAIELTDKVVPASSAVSEQQEILHTLLRKAANTTIGQQYNFNGILAQQDLFEAFVELVPYHSYEQMYEGWWKRQLEGETNVSWPGRPNYYALSSGTTGKESKRIPVTDDMLDAIRRAGIAQVLALANFDLPADFYEKEVMMLSSSTALIEAGTHREGEISGISASNIPDWFKGYYRPGKEISALDDWDERVLRIAQEAKNWDIGAISGIPAWNELMLKKIIEYNKLSHIHEIWPNLSVFASGGVAFAPYKKSFDALLGKSITVLDTYLASEGFLAYQARPNQQMAMKLVSNTGIYFEFVPFVEENIDAQGNIIPGTRSLSLAEIEEGIDYALIISTVAGAWRYMIGDTVRFIDKENAEIIITGRTKHFLNVVGSQLSVFKLNQAVQHLEERFHVAIPEFTVAAVRPQDHYLHHWYLGMENEAVETELSAALDEYLQEHNKNYRVARRQALKEVKVSCVPPAVFYAWNAKNKKMGGQVKMPRVMKEDEFTRWQDFVRRKEQSLVKE